MELTRGLIQRPSILDVEVGECAMDVSAHLLPGLSRSEYADDRHFRLFGSLLEMGVFSQLGVISGWRGLIVVDAVQSDAE
jgi:hypothetical protein